MAVQAILDTDLTQNLSKRTSSAQSKPAERHTIETFIEKLNESIHSYPRAPYYTMIKTIKE